MECFSNVKLVRRQQAGFVRKLPRRRLRCWPEKESFESGPQWFLNSRPTHFRKKHICSLPKGSSSLALVFPSGLRANLGDTWFKNRFRTRVLPHRRPESLICTRGNLTPNRETKNCTTNREQILKKSFSATLQKIQKIIKNEKNDNKCKTNRQKIVVVRACLLVSLSFVPFRTRACPRAPLPRVSSRAGVSSCPFPSCLFVCAASASCFPYLHSLVFCVNTPHTSELAFFFFVHIFRSGSGPFPVSNALQICDGDTDFLKHDPNRH